MLGGWLVFRQFLPEAPDDIATFQADGLQVRVHFDRACVENLGAPVTDDLIRRWLNISVPAVLIDVGVPELTGDLERFVRAKADWPRQGVDILEVSDESDRRLAVEYQRLGHSVLRAVLRATNRLASWAYAERGQYWVETRSMNVEKTMMSRNNEFGARVTFSDGSSYRWCPPNHDLMDYQEGPSEPITPETWQAAMQFLGSDSRPSLVGELLANAEALLASGRGRSGVLEAVCALEVAVGHFAARPDSDALMRPPGLTAPSLTADLDHLGFSRFVKYLLPLVVNPSTISPDELQGATEAIECRNRLAHGASLQRAIGAATAREHVRSLRRVIVGLRTLTLLESTKSQSFRVAPAGETRRPGKGAL
jgi:hypothetical protein